MTDGAYVIAALYENEIAIVGSEPISVARRAWLLRLMTDYFINHNQHALHYAMWECPYRLYVANRSNEVWTGDEAKLKGEVEQLRGEAKNE